MTTKRSDTGTLEIASVTVQGKDGIPCKAWLIRRGEQVVDVIPWTPRDPIFRQQFCEPKPN